MNNFSHSDDISSYYKEKLSSLHVDRSSGHPKPHKVCLMLAIIDLIKNNPDISNKFVINNKLKDAFKVHFEKFKKGNDANTIIKPFYHLRWDGVWEFKIKPGKQRDFEQLQSIGISPSAKILFDVIEYAYLDKELFNYCHFEKTRQAMIEALLENLEDLSIQFHRWLLLMGKSEKTANSYVGAIKGTISKWASKANISQQNIISIQSYSKVNTITEKIINYTEFVATNTKGKGMYSAALKSYKDFLGITSQIQVTEDIDEIINNNTISNTQKSVLINTRVGQGKFRESLIKYWHGCALTGYTATQFLVASHIKPWRDANDGERIDPYNGLLLLPNLDKAFDLGYISFSENGVIQMSDFIETPKILGIKKGMKIDLVSRHQDYLAYHRECIFERKLL